MATFNNIKINDIEIDNNISLTRNGVSFASSLKLIVLLLRQLSENH